MKGNQLILLNGPSSAGKSTIAGELQRMLALRGICAVIISIDDYMKIGTDEEIWEDDVFEVMPDMCRDITAALTEGKWVIADHVITSTRIYEALVDATAGSGMLRVLVNRAILRAAGAELRRVVHALPGVHGLRVSEALRPGKAQAAELPAASVVQTAQRTAGSFQQNVGIGVFVFGALAFSIHLDLFLLGFVCIVSRVGESRKSAERILR